MRIEVECPQILYCNCNCNCNGNCNCNCNALMIWFFWSPRLTRPKEPNAQSLLLSRRHKFCRVFEFCIVLYCIVLYCNFHSNCNCNCNYKCNALIIWFFWSPRLSRPKDPNVQSLLLRRKNELEQETRVLSRV